MGVVGQPVPAGEASLRALIATAPDAFIIVEATGRIELVNERAVEMFGYTRDELLGADVDLLLPERLRAHHVDHRAGYFRAPRRRPMGAGLDLAARRKDGSEFPVEIALSALEDGGRLLVTAIVRDVTDRKLAEEQIRSLNENLERRVEERTAQLEAANKELEAFTYTVSHDLRAPLRAMDGFSKILQQKHSSELSEGALRYLGMVRDNARQMGELVDDLLAFSRFGRQQLQRRTVAPPEIVRQCLDDLRDDMKDRRVEFEIGDLPPCSADPALLKQVYLNLLSNALKFTAHRDVSRIEIGSDESGGERAYFVKDDGVGFDMRYAGKLFDVFQRLHRQEDYPGTGVGLAIVQRIVHRHGGRVWAEGESDVGATFSFTIGKGAT